MKVKIHNDLHLLNAAQSEHKWLVNIYVHKSIHIYESIIFICIKYSM